MEGLGLKRIADAAKTLLAAEIMHAVHGFNPVLQARDADHGIFRDELGKLLLGPACRFGGAQGQHHVARVGGGIPNPDLHLGWQVEAQFAGPDGLVPAIVQDIETSKVLMLGFMNAAAIETTLSTKKVTFFSRSKNRLWTKGEPQLLGYMISSFFVYSMINNVL